MCCLRFRAVWRRSSQIKRCNFGYSKSTEVKSVECAVLSSLRVLYFSAQKADVRVGSLKILLHVLERCGEKLYYSWSSILEMLRSVADASEKDVATLGFQVSEG
jgi:hypothetical protein